MDEARVPLTPSPTLPPRDVEGGAQPLPYSGHHLAAVMKPVCLTMALAAWVVVNIRQPAEDDQLSGGLSVYMVNDESSGDSASKKFGGAVVNSLVIIGVIALATFILVACYYFRCLKFMVCYLLFASINLLGYTGGFVVYTAFIVYNVTVSWPTFAFLMYNFAVVGVVAVFWQKGVPRIVTQGYLVAVSVIMAWIVTKLPDWTGWTLLVALALYDLCAVLTPCGPLKALVNLAQERQDPIPGLLYEADVNNGDDANPDAVRDTFSSMGGRGSGSGAAKTSNGMATSANTGPQASSSSTSSSVDPDPPAVGRSRTPPLPTDQDEALARDLAAQYERADDDMEEEEEEEEVGPAGSIKLGLGDFVFYSCLVSRAALFDSASFAACYVSVVMGLAGTLALLAIARKALPALPISIFLGVAVYLLSRIALVPMIAEISVAGVSL